MMNYKVFGICLISVAVLAAAFAVATIPVPPGTGTDLKSTVSFLCDERRLVGAQPDQIRDAMSCQDLAAQQSMARSTRSIVTLSGWQLILAVASLLAAAAGTLAVVMSLGFSRRALQLTQMALTVQQETARHELRAYLAWDQPEVTKHDAAAGDFEVTYAWRNVGSTPALHVRRWMLMSVVSGYPDEVTIKFPERLEFLTSRDVPPGTEFGAFTTLNTSANYAAFDAKLTSMVVTIIWKFEDIFGDTHTTCYSEIRSGPLLADRKMNQGFKPIHPDIDVTRPSNVLIEPISSGGWLSLFRW